MSIKIGDKLEMEYIINGKVCIHISKVETLEDDGKIICISTPLEKNHYILIPNGTILKITVYKKDYMYVFHGKILSRTFNNIPILKISLISIPEKIQRRNFYRIETTIPIKIFPLDDQEEQVNSDGLIRDLSGGGIRIATDKLFQVGSLLKSNWNLAETDREISVTTKIAWIQENVDLKYKYQYGLLFINIDNDVQQDIIKYIFLLQRTLRKKGLI